MLNQPTHDKMAAMKMSAMLEALEQQRVSRSYGKLSFEERLGWLVDLDKPCFTGRQALIEEKKNGSRYNFVKLDIDGNKPAESSFIFTKREKFVGAVTSAMWNRSATLIP